ncbi:hypothetical protein LZ023_35575 (plasmid) [Pseudomonas silvicola]|nr:hypothetical protein LZ023_35575 [Pseudomonas silvicola]
MKIVMLDGDTLPTPPTRPEWYGMGFSWNNGTARHYFCLKGRADCHRQQSAAARKQTLKQLPDLRYICVAATGYDCIDLDACRERGIVVSNVPGYSTRSVSEGVIAALFALRSSGGLRQHARSAWPASSHFCVHRQPIQTFLVRP